MTELLQAGSNADAIRHVPYWMKKQRRALDVTQYPLASVYVVRQPVVVGIAVELSDRHDSAVPMIGALAANWLPR